MNFLPFTYNWLIRKNLNSSHIKSVLDLGCGDGSFGVRFNHQNQYGISGLDIYKPYIKKCLNTGKYIKVQRGDITNKLRFTNKSFDLVVCLETIEHLKKPDGIKLISEIERIAKKMIIISCPQGVAAQGHFDNNKYQKHQSTWFPDDFIKLGYRVFGIGLKIIYGTHTHVNHRIKFYTAPLYFLSFIANPIANMLPKISCQMIAIKKM